jgi:hypothetical protein
LPAYCNWFLIENLKYDKINSSFVEPYLPNHKIGIIHLAGKTADKYRFDKNNLIEFRTLDNKTVKKNIRFVN